MGTSRSPQFPPIDSEEWEALHREAGLKRLAAQENSGMVSIPISEYEQLLRDALKLKAIRTIWDEYHMKRKLIAGKALEDHYHRLRRKTLNRIGQIIIGNFD